ncbi:MULTISPECIES: hypothetical protein [Sulfitobacter]|uniref:hypothetical protein n=1 Tax=Sulfitobacter TaxID=60136 RepID=UPI00315A0055
MATQLDYALTNSPPAVYPGTDAVLTLTATLPAGQSATIQTIALNLTQIADLSENVTGSTALADWSVYDSSNSAQTVPAGHITLQPDASPMNLSAPSDAPLVLTFSISLLVTSSTGIKDVTLVEYDSPSDLTGTSDTLSLNVSDEIDGIYTFVAANPVLNGGGSTGLSWTGSSDYTYTLLRNDGVDTGIADQPLPAGGNGSYPQTGSLYKNVIFTLKAQDTSTVEAQLTVATRDPSHFTCALLDSAGTNHGDTLTADLYDKVTVQFSGANISQVKVYNETAEITTVDTTSLEKSVVNNDPPIFTSSIDIMATRAAQLTVEATGNGITLSKVLNLQIGSARIEASLSKDQIYVDASSYQTDINFTYANANAIYYQLGSNTQTQLSTSELANLTITVEPTKSETITVLADLIDSNQPQPSLWSESDVPSIPSPGPSASAPSTVDLDFNIISADVIWAKDSGGSHTFHLYGNTSSFTATFDKPVRYWTPIIEHFYLYADDGSDHTKEGKTKFAELQLAPGVSMGTDNKTLTINPTVFIKDKSQNRTYYLNSYLKIRVLGIPESNTAFLATRGSNSDGDLSIDSEDTGTLYGIFNNVHYTGNDSGDDHKFQHLYCSMTPDSISRSDGKTSFSQSFSVYLTDVKDGVTWSSEQAVFAKNTSSDGCGYQLINVPLPVNDTTAQVQSFTKTAEFPIKKIYHMLGGFDINTQDSNAVQLMKIYSGGLTSGPEIDGNQFTFELTSPYFTGDTGTSYHTGHGNGGSVTFLVIYEPK